MPENFKISAALRFLHNEYMKRDMKDAADIIMTKAIQGEIPGLYEEIPSSFSKAYFPEQVPGSLAVRRHIEGEEEPLPEKLYKVVLEQAHCGTIPVIKLVRDYFGWGLCDSKLWVVNGTPKLRADGGFVLPGTFVTHGVSKEDAYTILKKLETLNPQIKFKVIENDVRYFWYWPSGEHQQSLF